MVTVRFLRSYVTGPLEKLPPVTLPLEEYWRALLDAAVGLLDACQTWRYGADLELSHVRTGMIAFAPKHKSSKQRYSGEV